MSSTPSQPSQREFTKLQELAYALKVGDVMTSPVITVTPEMTIAEFRHILRTNRISGTPVVHKGRMVGIISIEDLIKALVDGQMEAPVGVKMTPNPVTLRADLPLVHAIEKFSQLSYGRFPVVDEKENLVGIIVPQDIIRALLHHLEREYHEEEKERCYRASHLFDDLVADSVTLVLRYNVKGRDLSRAGEASSSLRKTLSRLGIAPRLVRRAAIACYEAEMNIVLYADEGEITAEVHPSRIRLIFSDRGPGIPDIELAMKPGYSTAPDWVRELGFGAGMGLPNIKSCADEIKLESTVGVGTRLEVCIDLP
jgi:CBS domain-containing protein/anti-sigma regulatory factor (Ser/Thr protein kinase)